MMSAPNNSSLLSDQDTNQFLMQMKIEPQISYSTKTLKSIVAQKESKVLLEQGIRKKIKSQTKLFFHSFAIFTPSKCKNLYINPILLFFFIVLFVRSFLFKSLWHQQQRNNYSPNSKLGIIKLKVMEKTIKTQFEFIQIHAQWKSINLNSLQIKESYI